MPLNGQTTTYRMKLSRLRERVFGGESGGVLRGMLTLALGSGVARLIGVAAIPLLTRIYSPYDYGVLSVFGALVAIVAPVLNLRYVLAVPLPRTDAMAANLLALCGLLMIGTTALSSILLWAFGERLFSWLAMEVLTPWRWLIVLGALIIAMYEAMSLWATRRRAYGIISQTKVLQSTLGEVTKIVFGLVGLKPFGLLLGNVVEQGGGLSSYGVRFRHDIKANVRKVRRKWLWRLARYYSGFPSFRLPSQFLLVFSTQAPAMFAASLYGAGTTGQLGLALMALVMPASLIGQSASQAFYGEIARLGRGSEIRVKKLAYSVQKKLFVVGVPLTLLIVLLGEQLFRLIFGNEWTEAGTYAAMLAPFVLLQLTSAPLAQVLNVYNKQGAFLAINLLRFAGLLVIYIACRRHYLSPRDFVQSISVFLFLFYLIMTIYILYVVKSAASLREKADRTKGGRE